MAGEPERVEPVDGVDELASILASVGISSDGAALDRAWSEVSDGYRAGRPTPVGRRFSKEHAAAYAVARAPATVAATTAVLGAVGEQIDDWSPTSVLDVGAGLGTSSWAAMAILPSLQDGQLVERSPSMIDLGRSLGEFASVPAVRRRVWSPGDVTDLAGAHADLVLASYVLSELGDAEVDGAVDAWWAATDQQLVIVDTGTPAGFARILAARTRLIAAGAELIAPCPSTGPCPKHGSDWCHFAVRLDRSGAHRRLKTASLGFEDEKFSYVTASRSGGRRAAGRVLRHPQTRSGHVRVAICHDDVESEVVFSKAHRPAYRWARKARWGDAVPAEHLQ